MSEAEEAEFGSVARWTAQVASDLGPDYHVPAGCRGSGSPAALDWLIERMNLGDGQVLLDCGAGVGGPAAYAAQAASVRPVLVEPEAGACWAARKLFGYRAICAAGDALPLADEAVDAAWALGVLCTASNQTALLSELRRVVRPDGRIGLLVFVAHGDVSREDLPDNDFPDPERLDALIDGVGLTVVERMSTADLPAIPASWSSRVDEVTRELAERHGNERAWRLSEDRGAAIGRLLESGVLSGELLVLRRA